MKPSVPHYPLSDHLYALSFYRNAVGRSIKNDSKQIPTFAFKREGGVDTGVDEVVSLHCKLLS